MSTRIMVTAKLPFNIDKDGNYFVSYCPPLDVYSQGQTEQEAEKNLKEALSLFFITCFEMGTFDKVMKECGFKVSKNAFDTTQIAEKNILTKYIDVPIPFIYEKLKGHPGRCQA
ncbi:type II toxin-antitoxin system HicB family antitoxin [candidate division KSB1 bacterium]|nr:type II toxin-antitoxin system HicB family antitoxin [candidate division KSB1 bacterium]